MIPPRPSASRRGLRSEHGVDSRRFKVLRRRSSDIPMPPLVPVIISGGAGTRLWPLSREMAPKAFMRLPDGETLLGKTAARALSLPGVAELLTVTNRDLYFHTKDLYAGLASARAARSRRTSSSRSAATPRPRSRWPRMAVEARHGGDAVMLVLPADHLIQRSAMPLPRPSRARPRSHARGALVTFGIAPTRAETGFGYLECARRARRFRHGARRLSRPPLRRKA